MHLRLATSAFIIILLAGVLPAIGQNRPARATYGITGTVRDDFSQQTLENVRVNLKEGTGTPITSTFTRGSGEFEFSGIPRGDYIIEIVERDYQPFQMGITLEGGDRRGLTLFLSRPMTMGTAKSSGTISAHELSIPHKAHDEYEKGLDLVYSKSDYKGAIVQFQRAIKDFPDFYEAYAKEGNAYIFLKDLGPAEEAMRKSVALSSGQYSEALFLLASLLNNTKRFPEAETLSRQGVALDASSWHGHFELARALTALKRPDEAEKSAAQAREQNPNNPAVFLVLANIHIQLRDYRALLKDLDGYLRLSPTGPEADQARKTRDDLQAGMRSEKEQARTDERDQTRSDAPSPARPNAPDQSRLDKHEQSQSSDQDPPLLPPLPPPQPEP